MEEVNVPTVEDIRAAFGLTDEPDTDDSQGTNETDLGQSEPDHEQDESSAEDVPSDEGAEDDKPAEPAAPPQEDPKVTAQRQEQTKQNQAFARMRTENASMQKTLMRLAEVLGVDPRMPIDQLSNQLNSQARAALAKKNNMDPAILERLDHLEAVNQEYTKLQVQQRATTQLQEIKDKFGATDDDVTTFVNGLISQGYDASDPKSDLVTEFIKQNFSAIQQKAIDKAVAAEQERATKAGGASKPDKKQGQQDRTEEHDINTIDELNEFFSTVNK